MTVAGLVAGLLGAIAAAIAAWYAYRGKRDADRRRTRDVRPRVTWEREGSKVDPDSDPRAISLTMTNAGGAVARGYVIEQFSRTLYGGVFTLPAHISSVGVQLQDHLARADPSVAGTVVAIVGEDADGTLWDFLTGTPVEEDRPTRIGSHDFAAWVAARAGFAID